MRESSNAPHPLLHWAHPLIQEWFTQKFGQPTEPQQLGWPAIVAGKSTLISAPTGSGKTFAAFLVCIDKLVRQALAHDLPDHTQVVYISPLKALSNDIHLNLLSPLNEISQLAQAQGLTMKEIRVSVRTGDTPPKDRQAMLKKPPHIVVTTPESFYILLTAQKSRDLLESTHTVIVDEIHALANNKRGSHLSLSLERLEALCPNPLIRIGLSATQKPIEKVAHFLNGNRKEKVTIVDKGHSRQMNLSIEVPESELGAIATHEMWEEIYQRLAQLTQHNRSTLIFVNTRKLAERIAHHLAKLLGAEQVAAHHGSLSRKLRLSAETRLKKGELKVLVATASLELGIDIGDIDLVCQIGSPRSIAAALQRIGRSGHWHGAVPQGKFFPTTRDELIECAALIRAIYQGHLDTLIIPESPLDILAQQIVATTATQDWHEEDLFQLVTKAYPYRNLSRKNFEDIIHMLSEGIAGSRGRYGAYLFRDKVHQLLKARRHSRLTAIMNGGAIPDNSLYAVVAEPHGTIVGTLDEDFAVESNRGDIILLGSTSWQVKRVESAAGKVLVEDAHGAAPTVPFWRGEAPARTEALSQEVGALRQIVSDQLSFNTPSVIDALENSEVKNALEWLKSHCGLDQAGAEQLLHYIQQGRQLLGAMPTQKTLIAERFFDESGGMQLVIHAPLGARINKAWGLALRKKFCRSFNFELQAAATDDGINISLAEQHSFPLADVFQFLHPNTIVDVVIQAVLQSPLFATRWRWDATRALALLRFRNGRKIPPPITRMLSEDLLAAVFPDAAACQDNLAQKEIVIPEHPLIDETMKDILTEALDIEGLISLLQKMQTGEIQCIAVDTPLPSVFSHEILNANPYAFLDDAPLEERRARAVEMRRILPETVLNEIGKLDPVAITQVQEQIWPDIRNEDELHDTLQTLIALPKEKVLSQHAPTTQNWLALFEILEKTHRAGQAIVGEEIFWVAVEKAKSFKALYPHAILYFSEQYEENTPEPEEALSALLQGWFLHWAPLSAEILSEMLSLPIAPIKTALLKLEASGFILRGYFNTTDTLQWCERRILARIHRLTVSTLRRQIQPVTAAQFMQWLLHWQHLAPGTQLRKEHGLIEVIRQLQGFEIPANAWEKNIFAKRVHDYSPDMLDTLCLKGVVGWGRFSQPASLKEDAALSEKRKILPSSVAPITFFLREESHWIQDYVKTYTEEELTFLSHSAKTIYLYLTQKGASFFADIVRGSGRLKAEIETGLWELVTAGLITADGFDNLRALIDEKRRRDKKRRLYQARFSSGRWALLPREEAISPAQRNEALCWILLHRYGVVFRDLLVKEKLLPRWRELLIAFRRLEDKGEVRGGRFVSGFMGEQFALPYAVESLRNSAQKESIFAPLSLSPADPLNLIGVILPGEKVPTLSGKTVLLSFPIL